MNNDRNQSDKQTQENENQSAPKEQRSGAFKEPKVMDEKSTSNPEEEADMEQERKAAMTERD